MCHCFCSAATFSLSQVVTDIADTALGVLSLGAEIRAGLWRKNGQCMNDQVRFVAFRHVSRNLSSTRCSPSHWGKGVYCPSCDAWKTMRHESNMVALVLLHAL